MQFLDPVRVVCTKCPAVATVHHQEAMPFEDALLLWAECHGEHVLGRVDVCVYRASVRNGALILQHIEAFDKPSLQDMFEAAENQVQRAAKRADIIQRFLKAAM